ncbi:MAG: hypothetical protein FWD68_09275 [Alphaproteobacteria bacterium]|nr:hypothetical protein [Alphaproteobacteria bacterium]
MSLYDLAAPPLGVNPRRSQPSEYRRVRVDGTSVSPLGLSGPGGRDRAYEATLLGLLRTIDGSLTGQALFREIESCGARNMTILPETPGMFKGDVPNSDAGTRRPLVADPRKIKTIGPDEEVLLDRVGKGQNVDIHFTPGSFRDFLTTHTGGLAVFTAGAQPDEILLHEMVHAVRLMKGLMIPIIPLPNDYENDEEFFAILVANIYASETHRVIRVSKGVSYPDQRADHNKYKLSTESEIDFMPAKDDGDFHFVLVRKLVAEQPAFTNSLRQVDCPFNPIRRYFELTEPRIARN